ncbi:MAG: tetratricopeptide repeat protein [Candidatus Hydrogenedentes bacterium]|nr:tetratricopeptide repeat protein [Candidatus Hydrogenedentota bacterium]
MDPKEKQLRALRESLNVSPENGPLRRMVAESLLELKQYDDAEQDAKTALQYDNDDAGRKAVLARVLFRRPRLTSKNAESTKKTKRTVDNSIERN